MVKKFCVILCALSFCLACFASAGCSSPSSGNGPDNPHGNGGSGAPQGPQEPLGDDYSGAGDKIADFSAGPDHGFRGANGYSNGGMFDCEWSSSNVRYDESEKLLELWLTRSGSKNLAGEYRSNAFYGYGHYSVRMKAIKKPGVVSSFFTYTGRSDGNRWDEIDVEFLGNDTTKVQFNYFSDGVGGHEYLYDLGFDASESLHEYGFRWAADSITWYVDGKPVCRRTENIPVTPGRIMINAWPGKPESVGGWSGVFDGEYPVAPAEYEWIGYKTPD